MPLNPPAPPPTKMETVSKFVARHSEAVCLASGILIGALVTLLGVIAG